VARDLRPLVRVLEAQIDEAASLVRAAEAIRNAVPVGSHARRGFNFRQLEAMYELAYLRIFSAWEVFLEESFLRLMCGFEGAGHIHPTKAPAPRTIRDARLAVLGGRRFKPWHDPTIVVDRTAKFFSPVVGADVPHSSVISSALVLIKDLSEIRHHIAHLTNDTCAQYHAATMRLCGARFGRRAGRFLRSEHVDPATGLRSRWLDRICTDFKALASQFI
jgi:hypothetical protein